MERAPYGRRKRRDDFSPTYYGLPAVKPSHYRFLVITYIFVGGLAGAAQVIAAVADLFGGRRDRTTVRAGRYLAFVGSLICPVLLIADLHTKQRWFNMLRIYRPTSPMSIGSWTLAGFGTFSGATALFDFLELALGFGAGRALARLCGLPAALCGVVMSYYTGVLIAATSTPLWASAYRTLPATFAASAVATASAALSLALMLLGAPKSARRRVEQIGMVAGALELALSLLSDLQWRKDQVSGPLDRPVIAALYRGGAQGAGMLVPQALHARHLLLGRESTLGSALAAVLTLAGGYAMRTSVVLAGNASAENPEYYLRLTRRPDTRASADVPQPARDIAMAGARELSGG